MSEIRLDLAPHEMAVLLLIYKIGYDTYLGDGNLSDEVCKSLARAPISLIDAVTLKLSKAGSQAMELDNGSQSANGAERA